MPVLRAPTIAVHRSHNEAMEEFRAEGRGGPGDDTMIGHEIRTWSATWADPTVFTRYVEQLIFDAREESPNAQVFVPCTTLWWVDGQAYLARIAIRHRLNPSLEKIGGHIGYDVRPSARGKGHATAMLAAALPVARELGIARALVTIHEDNLASQRVVEANGAELARAEDGIRYYEVPTAR